METISNHIFDIYVLAFLSYLVYSFWTKYFKTVRTLQSVDHLIEAAAHTRTRFPK